jgi:hypothetical protein
LQQQVVAFCVKIVTVSQQITLLDISQIKKKCQYNHPA